MNMINDQIDTDVTAVSGMTEPMPPLRSFADGENERPDVAREAGILITTDDENAAPDVQQHYRDVELEVASSRIRTMLAKARGVIASAIGSAIDKSREFLTPHNRRIAVASGIGAIAAGTAIKKVRSHQ